MQTAVGVIKIHRTYRGKKLLSLFAWLPDNQNYKLSNVMLCSLCIADVDQQVLDHSSYYDLSIELIPKVLCLIEMLCL